MKTKVLQNVAEMTTADLLSEYCALTGKLIKKFASRAKAEQQVEAARAAAAEAATVSRLAKEAAKAARAAKAAAPKAVKVPKEKVAKEASDRGAAVATSWLNPETAAKRAERHGVEVVQPDGKKLAYRSVGAAFQELLLPMGKHIKFRMALKAEGKKVFEDNGAKYKFSIIQHAE